MILSLWLMLLVPAMLILVVTGLNMLINMVILNFHHLHRRTVHELVLPRNVEKWHSCIWRFDCKRASRLAIWVEKGAIPTAKC